MRLTRVRVISGRRLTPNSRTAESADGEPIETESAGAKFSPLGLTTLHGTAVAVKSAAVSLSRFQARFPGGDDQPHSRRIP